MGEAPWPGSVEDAADWVELSYRLGVTDGLPTHPPTRDAVDRLVDASGRAGSDVVGAVPPREGEATVEVVAANAAMAGCLPEHMPVLLAALDAVLDPAFNLRGVQTTTHGCWPLVIVSGPAVERLGFAHAESVFSGGGSRANLAVGRAIRLVLWNVGGGRPGEPVKEVFGHPGRSGWCIAESPASPWEPFHRAAGLDADSGVSVIACESPHSVAMWGCDAEPATRLEQVADALRTRGSNNSHTMGECLVALSPAEARLLAGRGLDRSDVQAELFRRARRSIAELRPLGAARPDRSREHWYTWWPDWVDQSDDATLVPVAARAEDIHVVVCGGDSIPWAAVCPGWGRLGGYLVVRPLTSVPA